MIAEMNIRCLSDYFSFKPSENGSVLSIENVCCMTCHKAFAYRRSNTSLINHLQSVHPIRAFFIF